MVTIPTDSGNPDDPSRADEPVPPATPPRAIPRGIEVLVKKASVDAEFKALLLNERAAAAREIDLQLDPAEAAMLESIDAAQLEAIIARTQVPKASRAAFLGKAAAAMLAAVGAVVAIRACTGSHTRGISYRRSPDSLQRTMGISPDRPR